jgi:hypothetical protein
MPTLSQLLRATCARSSVVHWRALARALQLQPFRVDSRLAEPRLNESVACHGLDLDERFFRVRIGRATKAELAYLAAMAHLGSGPYRSGEIAATLGRPGPESVAPHAHG